MTKILVTSLTVLLLTVTSAHAEFEHWRANNPDSTINLSHRAWSELLARNVHANADGVTRVDYAAFANADRARLDAYIEMLQAVTVTDLDEEQQLAYWINLYNAVTVQVVAQHYPVKSIRDIKFNWWLPGPWKEKLVRVESRALSLDNIEHDIVRPIFGDNRIHYAFNCASIGCPNLMPQAFTRDALHEMLDAAAREYVNHPRGVRVDDGELIVSSIYKWYAEDFGRDEGEVIAHFVEYAEPTLRAKLTARKKIDDYFYDWGVNGFD